MGREWNLGEAHVSVYKIIRRTPILFGSSAKVVKKALAGKEKIKEIKRFAAISLFGWKFIGIFAGKVGGQIYFIYAGSIIH